MKTFSTFLMLVLSTALFAQVSVKTHRGFFVKGGFADTGVEDMLVIRNQVTSDNGNYAYKNNYKASVFLFKTDRTFDINEVTKVELKFVIKDIKTPLTADYRLTIADVSSTEFTAGDESLITPGFTWFKELNLDLDNGPEIIIPASSTSGDALTYDVTDIMKTSVGNVDGELGIVLAPMAHKSGFHPVDVEDRKLYSHNASEVDINGDGTDVRDLRAELIIYGISTGVNEMVKKKFSMAPNPASTSVTLSGLEVNDEITISNISGAIVDKIVAVAEMEAIPFKNLDKGIYFVTVGNNTQRLIIE